MATEPGRVISTILKHDQKVTSYKIALLRAINDVVLSFPDIQTLDRDVAVPLRSLARFWIAYYWPFVNPAGPIMQGPRAMRGGRQTNDMAFREELVAFRVGWEEAWGDLSRPADGFFAVSELLIPRKRMALSEELRKLYEKAIRKVSSTIRMPIRHAGPGEWTVFEKPTRYSRLRDRVVPIPGTRDNDACLVIQADLWWAFQRMSLYVEALCIHEWCLFTERTSHDTDRRVDRGQVYWLLTDRPDNRRPLTWERNQVDLLLLEGEEFRCPWTENRIYGQVRYDMDHLLPVSVYPINELWNLVPSEPDFNSHVKRNRIPSQERLLKAEPHLKQAYSNYCISDTLSQAIHEDVAVRFATVRTEGADFPLEVTKAVVYFIDQVAVARNLARF